MYRRKCSFHSPSTHGRYGIFPDGFDTVPVHGTEQSLTSLIRRTCTVLHRRTVTVWLVVHTPYRMDAVSFCMFHYMGSVGPLYVGAWFTAYEGSEIDDCKLKY